MHNTSKSSLKPNLVYFHALSLKWSEVVENRPFICRILFASPSMPIFHQNDLNIYDLYLAFQWFTFGCIWTKIAASIFGPNNQRGVINFDNIDINSDHHENIICL